MGTAASLEYHEPFRLEPGAKGPWAAALLRISRPFVERILAFPDLNLIHARIRGLGASERFADRALRAMGVTLRLDQSTLSRIPSSGPLVVVANHPFGALDGLALLELVQRVRPDVKIFANHLLRVIPEMHDVSLFVNPFGGNTAKAANICGVRAAMRWVSGGGALLIFPAGEVSSLDVRARAVVDGAWNEQVAGLIRTTAAPVVPVFFAGRNSGAFQCAGLICSRLRTLMLPREVLKKRNSTVEARIGNPIAASKVAEFESDEELAAYLKVRTYVLAARESQHDRDERTRREDVHSTHENIALPVHDNLIAAEIDRLPRERFLAETGDLRVLYATASELRWTLEEIGRLREVTFRRVGEGTGRALDIDRFDQTYLHLLVWDGKARQVVGAYRMGMTDRIIAQSGLDGLYTSTLFRFRQPLLEQLGPAIELGRSFVRQEYQKEYGPLMLLWKGIAGFVARHPQYRRLFGPVSISNEYHSLSRHLLIEFLKHNDASEDLQRLVTPRNPPRFGPGRNWQARLAGTIVRSIEAVDELLGEIESDRAGMPVLLRQYLKLNAKLLGFNVDPDFGDVLDGLMLVDLTHVPQAILTRYMGREGADNFLKYHTSGSVRQ